MVEDDGVTQMQGIRKKIRDKENFLDLSFGVAVNIFTKEDRGFMDVRSLTRGAAKKSFMMRRMVEASCKVAAPQRIRSSAESKEWMGATVRSQLDT